MRYCLVALATVLILGGCATSGVETGAETAVDSTGKPEAPLSSGGIVVPVELPAGDKGTLDLDVTNAMGQELPARVDLLDAAGKAVFRIYAPEGKKTAPAPVGAYRALVHVYDSDAPVLAAVRDIELKSGATVFVAVNVIEGSGGKLGLRDFDFDGDLALDRVELEAGTNPEDAASVPGKTPLAWDTRVLAEGGRWYKGELNAHSNYGVGKDSVQQLVSRAESAGLDFLAITDRNSVGALLDPGFRSDKVALIPAMAWGNDAMGEALLYGIKTVPDAPEGVYQAQAECLRIQAQGGVFAVGHPCRPGNPWKWGTAYVNAVQVWDGPWNAMPPLMLDQLEEGFRQRAADNKFVYPLAAAAALNSSIRVDSGPAQTSMLPPQENDAPNDLSGAKSVEFPKESISANIQNAYFWDLELVRGLMACGIAGGGPAPGQTLGKPVTYILAESKSAQALVDGLRKGRTVMASSPDGVFIDMAADVMLDGKMDARIGDVVPLHQEVRFLIQVTGGQGKKLEVLHNGRAVLSKIIDNNDFSWPLKQRPESRSAYRARVIGPPAKGGKGGLIEVYAMTSPIYAQDITLDIMQKKLEKSMANGAVNTPVVKP